MNQPYSFLQKILFFSLFLTLTLSGTKASFLLANETDAVTITGKVIDALTEEPLPGANVRIKDTIIGDATDINGDFVIRGAEEGETILVISYLGFVTQEVVFNSESDEPLIIRLEQEVIAGEEVVVSVQAQGQREAINQQISSNTATNVVSSTKIQELPEANAAEAVGRLPGITLQREGGEGTKVIIRGLSPQYSRISLEGVTLSSTDEGDRSTDLSMISSYMLAGIEVSKAATADKEADQLGGNVNFRIREAPADPTFNVVAQGGYADVKNTYNDYKFVINGSNRFLDNKLGVFANLDLDRNNRSSNSVFNAFDLVEDVIFANGDTTNIGAIRSQTFQDVARVNTRTGATVVLDYQLPTTKLKYFFMYNNVETATTILQETIDGVGLNHTYDLIDEVEDLGQFTHSFTIEQDIQDIKITASGSINTSNRKIRDGIVFNGIERNAIVDGFTWNQPYNLGDRRGLEVMDGLGFLHPDDYSSIALNDIESTYIAQIYSYDEDLKEEQYSANLKVEYSRNITDNIVLDLEVGGKFKWLNREYDLDSYIHPMTWSPSGDQVRITWAQELQAMGLIPDYDPDGNANFPYTPFVDDDFFGDSFLNGQFELGAVPDVDFVRDLMALIRRTDPDVETYTQGLAPEFQISTLSDYEGDEQYYAAYILPTLQLGEKFTFIPGLRYEQNNTRYSGVRASSLTRVVDPFPFDVVEAKRKNEFWLPMIHARIDVTNWFDIKTSYTQTISRPAYNLISPAWVYAPTTTLQWNNPELVPAESDNYDLTLSFYTSKLGLVSIAGFYKSISNFIYQQNTYVIEEEDLIDAYPDGMTTPATVIGFINNPNDATLYGLEVEWQSNFWFLPGALSGLVAGFNYTYTYSEIVYPFVEPDFQFNRNIFVNELVGSIDRSYTGRLIDQPEHTANVTLGFDYKGFSIRGSLRHNSGVFTRANFFDVREEETDAITFLDLSITQQMPVQGLSVFMNATNINQAIDVNLNRSSGWYSSQEYYGTTIQLGVRYNLFDE